MKKNSLSKRLTPVLAFVIVFVSIFSGYSTMAASAETYVNIDANAFEDEGFRTYIKQEFDKDKDNRLSQSEILSATFIDVSRISLPIQNLKGVEYFTELKTYIDESKKSGIADYNFSNFKKLEYVGIKSENIRSINLSGCINLKYLFANNNATLKTINLSGCSSLKNLVADKTGIEAIDLRDAISLELVQLEDSPYLKVASFASHGQLKKVVINNTSLAEINLRGMPKLQHLSIYRNDLDKIDVSNNRELEYLHIGDNSLRELDISKNSLIKNLYADSNMISKFTYGSNNKLQRLMIGRNEIRGLDVSKFPQLITLGASNNYILSLDVSRNKELKEWHINTSKLSVKVNKDRIFDLNRLDPTFDMSKASNWEHATPVPNSNKIKVDIRDGEYHDVRFSYKSGVPGLEDAENMITVQCIAEPEKPQSNFVRLGGADRYETAIKIADKLKEVINAKKFNTIVVANGDNYADALSGAYLAKSKSAPLLLVNRNNTASTIEYIKKNNNLSGGKVYLLGGTSVLPDVMEAELGRSFKVVRLGGSDRFETNLKILKEAGIGNRELLICSAYGFADSLAASASGQPILLVGDRVNNEQLAFIKGLRYKSFTVIGGVGAINRVVMGQLKGVGYPKRVYGNDRYETSVAIAKHFFKSMDSVVLCSGDNFPDGLCGGVLAERMRVPLLLVNDRNTEYAHVYVTAKYVKKSVVLGAESVLPDRTVAKVVG